MSKGQQVLKTKPFTYVSGKGEGKGKDYIK